MQDRCVLSLIFPVLLLFGAWRGADDERDYEGMRAEIEAQRSAGSPARASQLPERWIDGVDCENEEQWQVHRFAPDLYILRQSKCVIYEAPFLYLIIGEQRALLMDTGSHGRIDVWELVRGVLDGWSAETGRDVPPLTVAHTHSHFDHVMGDKFFRGQEGVDEVVGLTLDAVVEFWGFEDFPNDVRSIDLGGRVLDVLGTPGHQSASVTLYDRKTRSMLSGDIVYPGHLFVFSHADWPVFVESIQRMVDFAREHPVSWVLGCHIEYSDTPGEPYPYGTEAHLDEHPLELEPSVLVDILEASHAQDGDPEFTIGDNFVLHPVYKNEITWNG